MQQMRILTTLFLALFTMGQIGAAGSEYATKEWWNQFWETSQGWGQPNERVSTLLSRMDGSKGTITVVDIGAGNGRNSVLALMKLFEGCYPKSHFVVHCMDTSEKALQGLVNNTLPQWLQIVTHNIDVNTLTSDSLPAADLLLLYGILEYVKEVNLSRVLHLASQALNFGGYLVAVSLVKGEGALEIAGETTRPADFYTQCFEGLKEMDFLDRPVMSQRPDRHDLGKGYPEDHLHYVYRTVLVKKYERLN